MAATQRTPTVEARFRCNGMASTLRRHPPAMLATLKTVARVGAAPVYLKRTLLIALAVGAWLTCSILAMN